MQVADLLGVMIILFMIYSRKIKWKLLLSIIGNEYQKNLFRTGIEDREKDALLEDATITMPEMAQQLRTTRSMINKWADKGKFTVIKVGSRVRIRRDEFEDWMEQKERSMQ